MTALAHCVREVNVVLLLAHIFVLIRARVIVGSVAELVWLADVHAVVVPEER